MKLNITLPDRPFVLKLEIGTALEHVLLRAIDIGSSLATKAIDAAVKVAGSPGRLDRAFRDAQPPPPSVDKDVVTHHWRKQMDDANRRLRDEFGTITPPTEPAVPTTATEPAAPPVPPDSGSDPVGPPDSGPFDPTEYDSDADEVADAGPY